MNDLPIDLRCKAKISSPGDPWHKYRCQKKATRDGYCAIHHPDAVKARDAKRMEEYNRENDALTRKQSILDAERQVVDVAKCWAREACGDETLLDALRMLARVEVTP